MKMNEFTMDMPTEDIGVEELKNHIMKEKEFHIRHDVLQELKAAIDDGLESGVEEDFDPELHLNMLRLKFENV